MVEYERSYTDSLLTMQRQFEELVQKWILTGKVEIREGRLVKKEVKING